MRTIVIIALGFSACGEAPDGTAPPTHECDLVADAGVDSVVSMGSTLELDGSSSTLCGIGEARFSWEPLPKLESAQPRAVIVPPLVRRIRPKPLELPGPRHEPDGWLIMGPGEGPVDEITGPHVVAGGWWMRALERAYYFVRTRSGRLLWIFDDRRRRRWFLHGEVE